MKTINTSNHQRKPLKQPSILGLLAFTFTLSIAGCHQGSSHSEDQIPLEYALEEAIPITENEPADADQMAFNTEEYDRIYENSYKLATEHPLSTFSIDVDNAAYSNVRRMLVNGQPVRKDAVRIEEMINYFAYNYSEPDGRHPFSFTTELSSCPWNDGHQLVHIGIKGKSIPKSERVPNNLVFLIDASGSMQNANKLPLLKRSFRMMINALDDQDRIAIVAYAGAAGLVLPSTPVTEKEQIFQALENINAGGSTAGGEGIELAYAIALENLLENGNNRVILATDGDFNIGTSSTGDLVRLIEEKRKQQIYLTICGFGMGNYKDSKMEQLSNAGNGNYFYIDHLLEAKKVFVNELVANMFTIAKDVKIQIEFNPAMVKAYRLIGYENRVMANEDFDNDQKDAGELGAGHTVTALYEIIPAGSKEEVSGSSELKYQKSELTGTAENGELMTLKFRYKPPKKDQSVLIEKGITSESSNWKSASENYRFSAAVAGFGLLLRDSEYKGSLTYESVIGMAKNSSAYDPHGYRAEFVKLVELAESLE